MSVSNQIDLLEAVLTGRRVVGAEEQAGAAERWKEENHKTRPRNRFII
jgi:hypothetical protein